MGMQYHLPVCLLIYHKVNFTSSVLHDDEARHCIQDCRVSIPHTA